ncbi:MAG: cyclic nucleotide-binding domain-containing protein [Bdellovibrionota bacterium]
MQSSRKMPSEFETADKKSKDLLAEILKHVPPARANVTVPATDAWYMLPTRRGKLYRLLEGMLAYRRDGRVLFSFNDGDLIGVENVFCSSDACISTEFAVIVDEYSADTFFGTINQSENLLRLWNEYLALQFKLFSIMLTTLVNEEDSFSPDLRFFCEGETIIREGTVAEEVYTLVEGRADVTVGDVKVGEVLTDEIFGALGGLSGTPRLATVTAVEDCMVVVITRAQFKNMLVTRPQTVIKLVEDMARVLQAMNDKVVLLSKLKV